jgi:hypothetical protein
MAMTIATAACARCRSPLQLDTTALHETLATRGLSFDVEYCGACGQDVVFILEGDDLVVAPPGSYLLNRCPKCSRLNIVDYSRFLRAKQLPAIPSHGTWTGTCTCGMPYRVEADGRGGLRSQRLKSPERTREDLARVRAHARVKQMWLGIAITVIGVTITVLTYQHAATEGGHYWVAWGAMVFGPVRFLQGLIGWMSARRTLRKAATAS